MSKRRLVAVLTSFTLVSGCGGSDEDTKPGSTPASRGYEPAAASRALTEAVAALVDARFVGFTFEMTLQDSKVLVVRGSHDIESGWKATTTINGEKFGEPDPVVLDVRAYHAKVWMQMREWKPPARVCWLPMLPTQVPVGITAFRPQEPGYITLLSGLQSAGYQDSAHTEMFGTGSLDTVAQLLPGQTLEAMGVADVSKVAKSHVPVDLHLRDGRLVGFSIDGEDIISAFAEAGYEVGAVGPLYEDSTFSGTYELGVGTPVSPPPAPTRVDVPRTEQPSCPLSRRSS